MYMNTTTLVTIDNTLMKLPDKYVGKPYFFLGRPCNMVVRQIYTTRLAIVKG